MSLFTLWSPNFLEREPKLIHRYIKPLFKMFRVFLDNVIVQKCVQRTVSIYCSVTMIIRLTLKVLSLKGVGLYELDLDDMTQIWNDLIS